MKRRSGPGAAHLDSVESAEQFISTHNVSVVGFFDVGFFFFLFSHIQQCCNMMLWSSVLFNDLVLLFFIFFLEFGKWGSRAAERCRFWVDQHRVCNDSSSWGFSEVWGENQLSGAFQKGERVNVRQCMKSIFIVFTLLPSNAQI